MDQLHAIHDLELLLVPLEIFGECFISHLAELLQLLLQEAADLMPLHLEEHDLTVLRDLHPILEGGIALH